MSTGATGVADAAVLLAMPPLDPDAPPTRSLLRGAVDEAVALLNADGGLVYLLDGAGTTLRLLEDAGAGDENAGVGDEPGRAWARGLEIPVSAGMFGRCVADRRVVVTGDYAADTTFAHTPETDGLAADSGIVSMLVAPLAAQGRTLGAIAVFASRPAAFGDAEVALVRSLAAHAAVTLANEALIRALGATASQLARRSERERTLRELVGSLATVADPEALLRQVLTAVTEMPGVRGALVDRFEPDGLHTHMFITRTGDGIEEDMAREPADCDWGAMGEASRQRRPVMTGDYPADGRFVRAASAEDLAAHLHVRSLVAMPLITDGEVLGVLAAHTDQPDAFDDETVEMMTAFAGHAAVAIANARRLEELRRSRTDLARRASEERALREVGASLTAIRNPDEVLEEAVEAVCRLVGGEWAEIARLERDLTMTWTHVYGLEDPALQTLQVDLALSLGEGMLGRAAEVRHAVVTGDYLADGSFRHLPKSDEFARVAGFRSLVAAPLVSGEDGVIGVLAVHSSRSHAFDEGHVALVDTFANIAAVAMGNARLIDALDRSEAKYRYLVDNSPDIVWSADAAGTITYISDTSEPLLGWRPEEVVGKNFSMLIHPSSLEYVTERYADSVAGTPERELRYRFNGRHRDGRPVPLEMHARSILEDGVYAGTHGACRDLRERERLERDLRRHAAELAASEERAHLARELHDSVTQALFSMTLVTKSIELLLDTDPATARVRLATLAELQADALAEMRALIFELRPASLETAGLAGALRTHCAALQGRTGLAVVLDAEDGLRLPGEVEAALFRVAQEALNNVVKHAAAHQVRVAVSQDGSRAVLEVEDDGAGFDPDLVLDGHLGLAGMRARAEKLGGRLELASARGQGTTVRAEVPLGPAAQAHENVQSVPAAAAGGSDG